MENLKRFDRLVALLIQLQSKKVVKAQDLADRFEVSLRTIYRDVRSLMEAGVPIGSEAGTGYFIVDGYHLPPVMFNKDEASAFLLAEKVLLKYADPGTVKRYSSALYKIKSVLRSDEKEFLDHVDENLLVFRESDQPGALHENHSLQNILYAANEKKISRMLYQGPEADQAGERLVEPLGILLQNTRWYLLAWCHMRQGYRHFRVDRILGFQITGAPFSRIHLSLKEHTEQHPFGENLTEIVIRVNKTIPKYIDIQKQNFGFISEKASGDQVEMTFLSASLEGFGRWYLMFADHAEIVSPEALKTQVHQLFQQISEKF